MKPYLKRVLRSAGLIKVSDDLRYRWMRFRNRSENSKFLKENPDIRMPPDYLLYEAHQIRYRSYFEYGRTNAKMIVDLITEHANLENKRLLDWGCGPSRIIRHMPELLPQTELFGSDYNANSIAWNKEHIPGVNFVLNAVNPPMEFEDDFFNAIYGLSIFTHLSEENHIDWRKELHRVSADKAILLLTTHGEGFREKLLSADREKFDSGNLVVHGKTLEGHRTYAAYQPPGWFKDQLGDMFVVLDHRAGKKVSWGIEQDKWILRAEK